MTSISEQSPQKGDSYDNRSKTARAISLRRKSEMTRLNESNDSSLTGQTMFEMVHEGRYGKEQAPRYWGKGVVGYSNTGSVGRVRNDGG